MNLSHFLNFNQNCPVCGEPLRLYAQVVDGSLWKTQHSFYEIFQFEQLHCKNTELTEDDFFWITNPTSNFSEMKFNTSKIQQLAKTWNFFFFFMCNENAFENVTNTSYEINPYLSCYYRSTPFMELRKNDDADWELKTILQHEKVDDIRGEVFTFKSMQEGQYEKVYILEIDNEDKKTFLNYYRVPLEEKDNKFFEPNIFSKILPQMSVRPNFEISQREQLIHRFDGWILMS